MNCWTKSSQTLEKLSLKLEDGERTLEAFAISNQTKEIHNQGNGDRLTGCVCMNMFQRNTKSLTY